MHRHRQRSCDEQCRTTSSVARCAHTNRRRSTWQEPKLSDPERSEQPGHPQVNQQPYTAVLTVYWNRFTPSHSDVLASKAQERKRLEDLIEALRPAGDAMREETETLKQRLAVVKEEVRPKSTIDHTDTERALCTVRRKPVHGSTWPREQPALFRPTRCECLGRG